MRPLATTTRIGTPTGVTTATGRGRRWRAGALAAALTLGVATVACDRAGQLPERIVPGSSDLGVRAIKRYGCGSCHTIPGIAGANALVGPPLTHFGRRSYVGGKLANTPENLARWVQDPQGVSPGTDMPNLGVSVEEARNIATYLEHLS